MDINLTNLPTPKYGKKKEDQERPKKVDLVKTIDKLFTPEFLKKYFDKVN
tara:strand:+ start:389 stop:538 length:150 start_codon:yes stop_codon:yes gene_type:complete